MIEPFLVGPTEQATSLNSCVIRRVKRHLGPSDNLSSRQYCLFERGEWRPPQDIPPGPQPQEVPPTPYPEEEPPGPDETPPLAPPPEEEPFPDETP